MDAVRLESIILFLFLIVISILILSIWRKVRRIDLAMWGVDDKLRNILHNEFVQLTTLDRLNGLLGLKYPLPSTRQWAGSPDFLFAIVDHALSEHPENVLECSCGTSTIVLARCMQINGKGHVYSLEHDPIFAEKTRFNLNLYGLSAYATVIEAPLENVVVEGSIWSWYSPQKIPKIAIDLLVIDGPPAQSNPLARFPAAHFLFDKLKNESVVFLDDAARGGEKEILRRWNKDNSLVISYINCEKGLAKLQLSPKLKTL